MLKLNRILRIIIVAALLTFGVAELSKAIGDKLLAVSFTPMASVFYHVSGVLNPLDTSLVTRNIAVRIHTDVRQQELQEEKQKDPVAQDKNVLGATMTVPVLMYHYIRVNPWPTDTVGFGLSVTPYSFAQQMDYLVAHGYHTISPDEFGAAMLYHSPLPEKPIIITLDDGYQDAYTEAYPILKKRGLKAMSFVITGVVGMRNIYLTWPEIEEMAKSGVFTFGAHTVHHPALTYLPAVEVQKEVAESKRVLEEHLGYPVNWFAYPYGNMNGTIANIVREAGFVGAFGTKFGIVQSPDIMFALVRIKIGGGEGVYSFASKLPWNTAMVPTKLLR